MTISLSFVATVLTACGIETIAPLFGLTNALLQQFLPLAVLKRISGWTNEVLSFWVATVLTVYGIETKKKVHKFFEP